MHNSCRRSLRAVREGRVVVVDGNMMFNRPSPRLLDALEWLIGLIHDRPDLMPPSFPWRPWNQPPLPPVPLSVPLEGAGSSSKSSSGSDSVSSVVPPAAAAAAAAHRGEGKSPEFISCAPGLPPDIEEAHQRACQDGRDNYLDPISGYMVSS